MQATANVLTVEDDPIVRADLRLVLEDAGFSVCPGARDGVEAVELAREHEPDVILLDLGLPRVDGIEVTRRILAERSVPIVAFTGRSRDVAERAVEAGVTLSCSSPAPTERSCRRFAKRSRRTQRRRCPQHARSPAGL